jgi:hypothetical protein
VCLVFYVRPISEPVLSGDGLPSVLQREAVIHDFVGGVADQLRMPTRDLRDHCTVASLMPFENALSLPVKVVTDWKAAHCVRKQITVESFDFSDLIADIYWLCSLAHASDFRRYGRHSPSAVPSGLASTTL